MPQPISENDLIAITDQELRHCMAYHSGKLSEQRRQAMAYYMGNPVGDLAPPEVEGRSSAVSTDVADVVEWILPSLLRIFAVSAKAVEFIATKSATQQAAAQATAYCNYVFYQQNAGFQILATWFKDALLQKNGLIKVWWEDRLDEAREPYDGLTDVELGRLLQDPEIEPIEASSRPDEDAAKRKQQAVQQLQQQMAQVQQAMQSAPPQATQPPQPPQQAPGAQAQAPAQPGPAQQAAQMLQSLQAQLQQLEQQPVPVLHDVVCKRKKRRAQVRIENIPPEEFLISRRAKTIAESPFCAHRTQKTISELKQLGYPNTDEITSDDALASTNQERIQRAMGDDDMPSMPENNDGSLDPSMRTVWITECYMRVDFDGDGIAEWRKITRAGNKLLDNEPCDAPPFVSITPVPLPHRFYGLSLADLTMPVMRTKTSVLRAAVDNLYLQVNGRTYAVEDQVNLDDLLTSRPGGVVRVKAPDSVGMLGQGQGDLGNAFQMLEYLETAKESRTGWSRNSQGLNPDALSNTATGVNVVSNRADMRVELIARVFAETGVTDLFRMVLKLVSQHQDRHAQIEVAGQWVDVDPREWRNGFDTRINVGLGTGNKDQVVQHIMSLLQVQMQGLPLGIAKPQNIYAAATKLAENLALPNPEAYFTDPGQAPAPNPQSGDQAKLQAQMQIEQMKAQLQAQTDQQGKQAELALERERMQMQAQVDTHRQQVEAQQKALEAQSAERLEHIKVEAQMQLEQFKAQMQQQTALAVARINAEATVARAELQASQTPATLTPQQERAADVAGDEGNENG